MKGKRFTEEQITYALRQAEGGTPVVDVCRQLGVSEASFYLWKKKYGKLGMTEIQEMRQLRDEKARLKRLVAELTLDKHILGEVVRKKSSETSAQMRAGRMNPRALRGERTQGNRAGAIFPWRVVCQEPS
jgi:putative transposase